MSIGTTIPVAAQHEVLTALCDRNQSGEIIWSSPDGQQLRSRVRFLGLSDDGLLVDSPTIGGRPVRLAAGEAVRLHFLASGQRMAFTSRVRGQSRWTEPGSPDLQAVALELPSEIERAQRRECYRLSVLHLPAVVVRFSSPTDGKRPPDRRFDATLMNISETGCGVVIDKQVARGVAVEDPYDVTFALPEVDEEFALPATVRWKKPNAEGDRVLIGVAWQLDPSNRESFLVQRSLARFVIEQQRQMLRRMREREAEASG